MKIGERFSRKHKTVQALMKILTTLSFLFIREVLNPYKDEEAGKPLDYNTLIDEIRVACSICMEGWEFNLVL